MTMKKTTCTTCDRSLPRNQFPKAPTGSTCTHERETCKRCWHQWLSAQVESKQWDSISCAQCANVLGQSEVRALSTSATYQKYLDSEIKATLAIDEQLRWCIAPGCKSAQVHIEGDIFRCVVCSHRFCVNCNVDWHSNETCTAYQARLHGVQKNEEDSAKMVEKIAKLCPRKGCGRKLEKISGCDHMTCQMCRHEFCWLCLAAQSAIRSEGNTAHKKDCRYHSENLAVSFPFNAH